MAAPENQLSFDLDIARQAGSRWLQYRDRRDQTMQALREGGVAAASSKERLAQHANRMLEKVRRAMPVSTTAIPNPLRPFIDAGPLVPGELDEVTAERIIGATRDFLSIEFLERGVEAKRSVGRVVTRLPGNLTSFGTGFMVSPRLLLTNRHVLADAQAAAQSSVEFNYQLDRDGNAMTVQRFALDPDAFFLASSDAPPLDFALVAVKAVSDKGQPLAGFGFCPLIAEEGKILIGQAVNIVQHPRGEMKQVALRENQLVALLDDANQPFAHYICDTDRGSSGSPVFNDAWEVIALHHSAVPKMDAQGRILDKQGNVFPAGGDPENIDWTANEGVRVSRLVQFLRAAAFTDSAKAALRDGLLNAPAAGPPSPPNTESAPPAPAPPRPAEGVAMPRPQPPIPAAAAAPNSVSMTIPLTITISLGGGAAAAQVMAAPAAGVAPGEFTESTKPDQDYSNRAGFDPHFLGFSAPLPALTDKSKPLAVTVPGAPPANPYELKYFKYSVIMNGQRHLAFVSAVNFDPDADVQYGREGKDTWYFDPRIPQNLQAGGDLYLDNPLDKGHLTRRADAAWGADDEEARLSNNDTFHWTNCSPQHEIFNQSAKATARGLRLWGNLENHVTEQANKDNRKISIFNGSVFRPSDARYRGIRLPREFWKMIVFKTDAGKPAAVAFVLSQSTLIKNLPQEEFEVGPYGVYQVRLTDLEKKTNLDFSVFKQFEPFPQGAPESFTEADVEIAPLQRLADVRLA
jgi:endonuclease G